MTAPPGVVAFPVGLALSPETDAAPRFLYVANANVDLRFNGGSVQSYDLDEVARRIKDNGCLGDDGGVPEPEVPDADLPDAGPSDGGLGDGDLGDAGEPGDADAAPGTSLVPLEDAAIPKIARGDEVRAILCNGNRRADGTVYNYDDDSKCCFGAPDTLSQLRKSEIPIDSFASAIGVSPDGKNVFVPVRSKTRLVYITADTESGVLSCGASDPASGADGPVDEIDRCRSGPTLGDEYVRGSEDNSDPLGFAAQPTSLVVGSLSQLDRESEPPSDPNTPLPKPYFVATTHETGPFSLFKVDAENGKPELIDVLPNGPLRSLSVSLDPLTHLLYVASAAANTIARVGLRVVDTEAQEREPVLYESTTLPIIGLSSTFDIRDVQLDNRPRLAPYPVDAYALLRGTGSGQIQSVVFLRQESSDGRFSKGVGEVRLGAGPSKMLQADIDGRHLLFVSCYQRGSVYVVDADQRQVVSEIKEFSGPFDMKIDLKRELLYVTDYGASVVRVADLRGLTRTPGKAAPPPRIVATLGRPYFTGSIQ